MIKGIKPSLAEGGKIKIGGLGSTRQSKSGKPYRVPEKWDHFEITGTGRNAAGDLEPDTALMAAIPRDADGKLRSIPVVVHSDEIDEIFPTIYARYGGKQLLCRGDGETAEQWPCDSSGHRTADQPVPCACPCAYLGAEQGPVCKPHGTLHCSIAVEGQAIAGAVHRWRTTSLISIQRMIGSIIQIQQTVGSIRGLPLVLRVEPVTVSPGGKTSTVYCCHLELRASDLLSLQRRALEMAEMRRTVAGGLAPVHYRALIQAPAADTESPEEAEEVDAEFYPHEEAPPTGKSSFTRPSPSPAPTSPADLVRAKINDAQTLGALTEAAALAASLQLGAERDPLLVAYRERRAELEHLAAISHESEPTYPLPDVAEAEPEVQT